MQKFCPFCFPTKRASHTYIYIEYYVDKLANLFFKPFAALVPPKSFIAQAIWRGILQFFELLGILKFSNKIKRSEHTNRSLIFWDEAKKRKIPIFTGIILGRPSLEFKYIWENKTHYYTSNPLLEEKTYQFFDDKWSIRKKLSKYGIPVPKGKLFTNKSKAIQFGKEMGFPLVVKPHTGSLSHHVTVNIRKLSELENAIDIAKQYEPAFFVEKYLVGNMYRATVLGKQEVFVCHKEKPNVVGNGRNTIENLIKQKNTSKLRGNTNQANTTLHKIPVTSELKKNLEKQDLTLQSVLPKGQKVYLYNKDILSLGCDIIEYTEKTHQDNKALFIKIAEMLDEECLGIDFICPDITKSYNKQVCGMLETNTNPFLDMHQFPSIGKAQNVAKVGWNFVLKTHK